jgi:hypothetical protein
MIWAAGVLAGWRRLCERGGGQTCPAPGCNVRGLDRGDGIGEVSGSAQRAPGRLRVGDGPVAGIAVRVVPLGGSVARTGRSGAQMPTVSRNRARRAVPHARIGTRVVLGALICPPQG